MAESTYKYVVFADSSRRAELSRTFPCATDWFSEPRFPDAALKVALVHWTDFGWGFVGDELAKRQLSLLPGVTGVHEIRTWLVSFLEASDDSVAVFYSGAAIDDAARCRLLGDDSFIRFAARLLFSNCIPPWGGPKDDQTVRATLLLPCSKIVPRSSTAASPNSEGIRGPHQGSPEREVPETPEEVARLNEFGSVLVILCDVVFWHEAIRGKGVASEVSLLDADESALWNAARAAAHAADGKLPEKPKPWMEVAAEILRRSASWDDYKQLCESISDFASYKEQRMHAWKKAGLLRGSR